MLQFTLKRFGIFIAVLMLSLVTRQAKASHAMGADLSYQCIDPQTNTYKVILHFYRDCAGIDAPTSILLDITSQSCGQSLTATLQQDPCPPSINGGQPCEVSPLCFSSIAQSTCNGGTLPGVEAFTYSAIVQLPANCPDWVLSFSECCRNSQITNLLNADSEDLYVEAHLNNTNGIVNNSPDFTTLPVPFICANQPFSYNHGAVDADGDSLVYTLINPLGAGATQIQYNGTYSPTYPLTTSPANSFGFDNNTGQMTFTPNGTQVAVVTVLVEEYRNGVLIGSTMRDIQIVVVNLPGCANPAPTFTGALQNTVNNGIFIDNFHVQVCPGQTLSFNTLAVEQSGDSIYVESNIAQAIPAASYAGSYLAQDSFYSNFSWTPTGLDTGSNVFIVTVKNNHCPLASNLAFAINVEVLAGTYAGPDISYCPAGGPVHLQAYGGSQFTWSPSTGLSDPNISNPTAHPTQTTTYVVTSNLSNNCKNKDTMTVAVVPDFTYTFSQSDDTICRYGLVYFNINPQASYGPFTYHWTPDSSLLAGNIADPAGQPYNTQTYYYTVVAANGCTITDSARVVVDGQGPYVKILSDRNKVCVGDTINLNSLISNMTCGLNTTPCTGNYEIKTVGTGNVNDFGGATPYRGFYMDARMQILYRASELQAMGMQAGTITDIAFDIAQTGSTIPYDGFSLKMGCTNLNQLNTFVPGLSTVMNPISYTPTGTGFNTHTFDNPYDWDGISNLILEICFDNNTFTNDDIVNATNTSYNSVVYSFQDLAVGCNLNTPFTSQSRPNTQFIYCVAPLQNITYSWSPVTNLFTPDTLDPYVVLDKDRTYFLTANDGVCDGGNWITLNIDTSYGVDLGPDVPICNGVPVQLNANVYGTPPLNNNLNCGVNGTSCTGTPVVKEMSTSGSFAAASSPFYGDFFTTVEDEKSQILYKASDLLAAGFTPGTITSLGINIAVKQSVLLGFANLQVSMGCTNKTDLDNVAWEPTTPVYSSPLFTTTAGWTDFPLQAAFDWDGASNLVVEICWDNPDGTPSFFADQPSAINASYTCFHYVTGSTTSGCTLTPSGVLGTELPLMRWTVCPPPPLPPTFVWTPTTALSADSVGNPIATPTTTTTYAVTAYFGGKCPRTDTITITPQVFNYSLSNDTNICEGQTVNMAASGGTIYQWSPATGLSCSTCADPVATPANTTAYAVTITDGNTGCVKTDTVLINVQNLSATALYYDTLVDQGTPIVIGADVTGGGGPGTYTYSWEPAQYLDDAHALSPTTTPLTDVLYTLTVNSGGCSDTTTVSVRVNIIESPVYMPSAFTPNGDGKNDGFYPVSFNNIATVKEFRIYNRYGEMIHNSNAPWDGRFKGKEQPSGTYVYYIVISRPYKDDEGIQGAFSLLR